MAWHGHRARGRSAEFEIAAGKTKQRDLGGSTEYVPLILSPQTTQHAYTDLFAVGVLWFVMVVLKPVDYYHVQPVETQQADRI